MTDKPAPWSIVAAVAVSIVVAAPMPARAQLNHLTCFRAGDPARFQASVSLDMAQVAFDPPGQCRVVGRANLFCVPSQKTVNSFEVDGAPGSPLAVPGFTPVPDRLCYKLRCPRKSPATQQLSDQFGTRDVTVFRTRFLCTPAREGLPTTTTTTTSTSTTTTLVPAPKLVFVSSATYIGNLGGITAADQKCQDAADAVPALAGKTWKAWLYDGALTPITRMTHSSSGYQLLDGTTVAADWKDLVDGFIDTAISLTEVGTTVSGGVWTGTSETAQAVPGSDCFGWISSLFESRGTRGSSSLSDRGWTVADDPLCTQNLRLYCFEQ